MDRIEQAIRESLVESYLYRESTGDALLAEHLIIWKTCKRKRRFALARRVIEDGSQFFRGYCMDPALQIAEDNTFRKIGLEDFMQTILENELQKMRTE